MGTADDRQGHEVAIIGGGAAGLSAAIILARARRSVIVIDSGHPRNAPAAGVHGFLGNEGISPLLLVEKGREEATAYGARVVQASVTATSGAVEDGFTFLLSDGSTVQAGQVLIATGVVDELPSIPGLAERWGRDVVHCPYCHGWEIRDQRIGLLATGPMSALQALMFRQWSEQVWFFPNGMNFPDEQLAKLHAMSIMVVPGTVVRVDAADDQLTGVVLEDQTRINLDALAVPSLTHARLDGLEGLGVEVTENAAGVAVVTDAAGHTSVPGVWAAGNVANPATQVSDSAADGGRVARAMNTELVFARADQAVGADNQTVSA